MIAFSAYSILRSCLNVALTLTMVGLASSIAAAESARPFNGPYQGRNLNRVAFPIGGIGAGMFCLEGTGAVSHVSVRNQMEFFHEPATFAALCVLGENGRPNVARIVEGPIPDWKYFGGPRTGNGNGGTTYGLPRFRQCEFLARFPFAAIKLNDAAMPLGVKLVGWSPFTPPDADSSSLPAGALEYRFHNHSDHPTKAVFSFNTVNFLGKGNIGPIESGFVLRSGDNGFAVFAYGEQAVVDHCWFRGRHWFDARTILWNNIEQGNLLKNPPVAGNAPGGSLAVPFELGPGEEKTIRLLTCWYSPTSTLRFGKTPVGYRKPATMPSTYVPWYATKFKSLEEVASHWRKNYEDLRRRSEVFRDAFYDTTLPPEVVEAVAANLTILKSPTILRQHDGRLWCYEGCRDGGGCCAGTTDHVWNYAQAICHLFPSLERGLRQTEYHEGQNEQGKHACHVNLPISPSVDRHVAADGQLGGIMKAYREWRILGDENWLTEYWPLIKRSLDYMIETFDPRHTGILEESHFNTYDIYYFGPNGHCGSFYLGALAAAIEMGTAVGDDVGRYRTLLEKGRERMEKELYNGEYFFQIVMHEGLNENFTPLNPDRQSPAYRQVVEAINKQGPNYQYGKGCLSDGVLGAWMAAVCGMETPFLDPAKIRSHLLAVYKHNLKHDLSAHDNPQRPTFAMGNDGGLLLCTWPRGEKPLLPFVYSNEVWTGIEYQAAAHLMMIGAGEEGLDIVRTARRRYDGVRRNPFNEYECGHWYARALSSYALLQGMTGVRYDAVTNTLFADPRMGDFRSFLCTNTGFGTVSLRDGKLSVDVKSGKIPVEKTVLKTR